MDESAGFGLLLRRYRTAAELTQEALAERAGMSARTISDLERGINRTPRKDTLEMLADALRLSPQEQSAIKEAARRATGNGAKERLPTLRIEMLGGFRVTVGDRALNPDTWTSRKGKSLVKILALAPSHRLQREQVIEMLWPDVEPRAAANRLHQIIHGVRCVFGAPGLLRVQDDSLVLDTILTDVEAFEDAAAQCTTTRDADGYRAAIDLYAGDLLPEDRYEEWCQEQRERLREARLRLLLDLGRLHEAGQEYDAAASAFRRVLVDDPLHEGAHGALMRTLAWSGRPHQALRQFRLLQDALQVEMGTVPQPATRELYEAILAGRFPPEFPAALPSPGVPERHVATDARSLAPRSKDQAVRLGNIPLPTSSFIGRVYEQEHVSELLTGARLLTLVGPGGCGKTRLAIQIAAAQQRALAGGAWMVDLAPVRLPSLVIPAVASALGLLEQPGRPPLETLVTYLQGSSSLLLLDNCEHLVAECASLTVTLLHRCPHLRVLATSREPLHVPGEVLWHVRSLSLADPHELPPLSEILQYEAIQLFIDRAQERQSSFTVTAENAAALARICLRLDGIPLAIELAAARIRVLSLEQIERMLDDVFRLLTGGSRTAPDRQQTLRATLDWSYRLLSAEEQAVFRRLSVFAGDFSLAVAEVVGAGDGIDSLDILDLLTQLVDKSLVLTERQGAADETRYRLLETVRQYGLAILRASKEEVAARECHRNYYLHLTEQANANLWSEQQDQWLQVLELEQDNVRAAMSWCTARGDTEAVYMLSRALWQFWMLRGRFIEGRQWLADVLRVAPDATPLRADLLDLLATVLARHGDLKGARLLLEESLAICRTIQDRRRSLEAVQLFGIVAVLQFDYIRARAVCEEGLALAGDLVVERACLTHVLGHVRALQGDYRSARAFMEESLEEFRALGDRPRLTSSLLNVAWAVRDGYPYGHASMVMEDTWALFREIGSRAAVGHVLVNLGGLARLERDHDLARRRLDDGLHVFQSLGDRAGIALALALLGNLAISTSDYSRAGALLEESLVLRQAMGDRPGIGRTLSALAHLAQAEGDRERARDRYDEAMALFTAMAHRPGRAWLLNDLIYVAIAEGDHQHAMDLNNQLAIAFLEFGAGEAGKALSLANSGVLAQLQCDNEAAKSHFAASLQLFREQGDQYTAAALRRVLAEIDRAEDNPAFGSAVLAGDEVHKK